MDPRAVLQLLRPRQWLKNLMLFFPPFLGGTLLVPGTAWRGAVPFAAFCLVSSATYVLNDLLDRDRDLHHPDKRRRPIPSGKISPPAAVSLALVLVAGGFVLSSSQTVRFSIILGLYLAVSSAYSFWLKRFPIIDIFCISAGFLLRLIAGSIAFAVPLSEWLFLSVFLLSVFLSTGKRMGEKSRLGSGAASHRASLDAYPPGFLPGTMYMTGAAVLVTYTMYVISRHSSLLLYSVPLCCFGLLRYMLRVQGGEGGDPTESLLRDFPLFATGLLWALMVGWGIYAP